MQYHNWWVTNKRDRSTLHTGFLSVRKNPKSLPVVATNHGIVGEFRIRENQRAGDYDVVHAIKSIDANQTKFDSSPQRVP